MRRSIAIIALLAPLASWAAEADRFEVLGRAELPSSVEAAFARQASDKGIEHIRRVVDARGHVTYSAKIVATGRTVDVAADGTVLGNGQ